MKNMAHSTTSKGNSVRIFVERDGFADEELDFIID